MHNDTTVCNSLSTFLMHEVHALVQTNASSFLHIQEACTDTEIHMDTVSVHVVLTF